MVTIATRLIMMIILKYIEILNNYASLVAQMVKNLDAVQETWV